MGTIQQKKAARRVVKAIKEKEPITGAEIVREIGYSKSMQRKPGEVLSSPGVLEELEILGFTEEKAKGVVSVILGDEKQDGHTRLKAADMVFKVHGTYAAEKSVALNVNLGPRNIENSDLEAIRQRFEDELKAKLIA